MNMQLFMWIKFGQNNNLYIDLDGISFSIDEEGNWRYIPSGTDTLIPFKNLKLHTPGTATAISTLSGTASQYVGTSVDTKYTIAVVFDTPFDTLPTIKLSLVSAVGDREGDASGRSMDIKM